MTTSLAEHGFLSDETAGVVEAVEQRYATWLTLFRSVNGRAVKAQDEAQIPRAYLPALVAAACYMRTLTNIQAAVLLIVPAWMRQAAPFFGPRWNRSSS